jgi:hypothetical protein
MKLTESEKEVIYRALDTYIAKLNTLADSRAAYEVKTAREIRSALEIASLNAYQEKNEEELNEVLKHQVEI